MVWRGGEREWIRLSLLHQIYLGKSPKRCHLVPLWEIFLFPGATLCLIMLLDEVD